MPGVADDDRISTVAGAQEQSHLGERESRDYLEPGAPLLLPPLPNGLVALADLDPRAAEARNHLGVTGIAALVGAEVDDPHPGRYRTRSRTIGSSTSST